MKTVIGLLTKFCQVETLLKKNITILLLPYNKKMAFVLSNTNKSIGSEFIKKN